MSAMELVTIVNRSVIPAEAPDRILVVPWGEVASAKGHFVVDVEAAARVLAAFERHGVELPIDLEHQTLGGEYSSPDGSAPAMAWISAMEPEEGVGIWATVAWTARGAEYVRKKEYRYLSPVTVCVRGTGRVLRLHSVALTNKPAIEGMPPVANKDKEPPHMDGQFEQARWFLNLGTSATETEIMAGMETFLTQLRELVGVPADADQGATTSALKARLEANSALRQAVCKSAGLDPTNAADTDIVAAAGTLAVHSASEPDPKEFVPHSEYDALAKKVATLEKDNRQMACKTFMEGGRQQGRIAAHNEKRLEAMFLADPDNARAALEVIPEGTFPKPGRVTSHAAPVGDGGGGRGSLIAQARDEFKAHATGIACTEKEYVNEALRESNEGPLTDEEVKAHSVAA